MGGPMSEEQQKRLWTLLGIVLKGHIVTSFTYKQFAGIAALVERVFASEFEVVVGGKSLGAAAVSRRSEIEIADFDRLASKMEGVRMSSNELKDVLELIKESG